MRIGKLNLAAAVETLRIRRRHVWREMARLGIAPVADYGMQNQTTLEKAHGYVDFSHAVDVYPNTPPGVLTWTFCQSLRNTGISPWSNFAF